jgi:alpha/beta superfamily hydrolase
MISLKMPEQAKPMLTGAALGAAALAIIGFTWGGWVTANAAQTQAKQQATSAVVAALAPICLANFRSDKESAAQLIALKRASSWEQATFVEKSGWATMPGTKSPDTATARACAELFPPGKS